MNQVVLVGRIVRDIELKPAGNQHQVVNNVLAINRRSRQKNGDQSADFIPIVAWNQLAEILHKYCKKGQRIAAHGKLHSRNYTTQDNQQRYVIECVLNEITLLDRPNHDSSHPTVQSETSPDEDLVFSFEPVES